MENNNSIGIDSEQLYRLQVRQLRDYAMFFIGVDGRIKTWNKGVEHLLGYTEEEWVGRDTSIIFIPADKAVALRESEMDLARQNGCVSDIRWHRRKDGSELFANGVMSAVYDAPGTLIGFTKIISDETSRKQLEDSLLESNSALEQFAYAASHDLQEPLRTIGSYAELITRRHGSELGEEGTQWLAFIIGAVARMKALIENLLNYARVGAEKEPPVCLSLDQDVETAIGQLSGALQEADAAVTHDPLPAVVAAHSQIVRLFQNLISNAIKYRSPDRKPTAHISARPEGKYWVISVQDNGIGFAQEYADSLFTPFKRLHGREYSGSGVGLAICRRIVENHAGRIWAESSVGEGSTFHFTVPRDLQTEDQLAHP
ncbi:MAG TPA: ATP-binding protein [Bryobacteraceae bacterium]|nr:ATP-binding protein [Bryobacteraceae bacterium]